MLTRTQIDAIHEYIAIDEPVRRLISLARTDLYHGPLGDRLDEDDADPYPGFVAACRMIGDAMPRADLYIVDDEVIGDVEPLLGDDCDVMRVDSRLVVRLLVGAELSQYV